MHSGRPACVLRLWDAPGSHSPPLICCVMERRPRSGDTAFRPLNWPFLLLGLFKTVLGWLPPVCCLGGGEDCWSKWPCEIPRQTGSSQGRVGTSSQGLSAPPFCPCGNGQKAMLGRWVGRLTAIAYCKVRPQDQRALELWVGPCSARNPGVLEGTRARLGPVKEGFPEEMSPELCLGGPVRVEEKGRVFQVEGTAWSKAWW